MLLFVTDTPWPLFTIVRYRIRNFKLSPAGNDTGS